MACVLLRPFESSVVVWSMLVSPEMTFREDASIQLDYWLWFNISQPHTPVSFMLFRSESVKPADRVKVDRSHGIKQKIWSN